LKGDEFFHAGIRAQSEKVGRILLGDNTGRRSVVLRPIRFQWTEFPCTYIADYMYNHFRLAQNWTCARPSGT